MPTPRPVHHLLRRPFTPIPPADLPTKLPRRHLPPIVSTLTPDTSHALTATLASFLPHAWTSPKTSQTLHSDDAIHPLPPAHHLVYFNPAHPANFLLPDGTDPSQSPGEPWVRRMWAGGRVRFVRPEGVVGAKAEAEDEGAAATMTTATEEGAEAEAETDLMLDRQRWACIEGIRDVQVKGAEGAEKVFVGIERRMGRWQGRRKTRQLMWPEGAGEDEWGVETRLVERRNLVFMRGRSAEEARVEVAAARGRMLMPQHTPDFEHTLLPTSSLLFRFSALTFNAHAIHLDPDYCRTVEGHRNLLVHGPLALTLLVTMLQNNIPEGQRIAEIEYRNLAPMYCGEPLKLCGRKVEPAANGRRWDAKYEVWAETPEGGMAVKGTAYTTAA